MDRCLFFGFRSNASKYFRYLDYFVMPSRSEGFGLALVEAVKEKVPVICSDLLVFKELFTSAEVTFFKLDDIDSFEAALKEADAKRAWKSDLAYKRYIDNYTDWEMARCYKKVYNSV
jgi:glycosyltransferase involved in cell wall biosynthesis